MLKSELKTIVERKISMLEARRKFLTTWELIKEKDFHINPEYMVIDRQEFRDLVMEAVNEALNTLAPPKSNGPSGHSL
jgi:hypothetical protein